MLFATPIWLLALIPWAAVAVWMLWGRRERVEVPFLALWRNGEARPSARRAVQAPPAVIVLLLLAALLAILAAASPRLAAGASAASVTVLVDRGVTMSAREGDAYRYQRSAALLAPHLWGSVRVLTVPSHDEQWVRGPSLADAAAILPPTAVDTSDQIAQAALRLRASTDGPVIVLTDRTLPGNDPHLLAVPPPAGEPPGNVGVEHVAAREKPVAQVMVRVHADQPATRSLAVTSDGQRIERTIEAPGTFFLDLPRLGETIEVALTPGDALTADDRAWLVREAGWPRVEPRMPLSPEMTRMVEVYRTLRPARPDAEIVPIVDAAGAAGEAVILAPALTAGDGAVHVAEHPVTAGIAWDDLVIGARMGGRGAPKGFVPVVSVGANVAVAVREAPRQVWVALDAPAWAQRPEFVVFWTNVFDWLGRGGEAFVAHPIAKLDERWRRVTDGPAGTAPGLWPGLYERGDGTLRAVNAQPPQRGSAAPDQDWRRRLSRLAGTAANGPALSRYLLLGAMACAVWAAMRWPARRTAPT